MIEFLVFFSSVGFVAMLVKNYFLATRVWNLEQRIDSLSIAIMSLHIDQGIKEIDEMSDLEREINKSNKE